MDSGNSGSLQSSSGGEEEYDSRAAAFMSAAGPAPPIQQPFFDPLSSYLFNPSPAWPRAASRPGPNPNPNPVINHDGTMLSNSSSSSFMPSFQPDVAGMGNGGGAPPPQNRNPKKRSRASRRAPTTVLTTDTTNFRAMVQEFTGIPAPPFSSSSFPRSRLDFFSSAAQPPPYLRRPFPQKLQPQHSLLTSSPLDALTASSPTSNHITSHASSPTSAAAAGSNPSVNYQLPITQNSNLFNIQNPLLSSLLQSNSKFPFSTSPIPSNINDDTLFSMRRKTGVFTNTSHPQTDQFSLGNGNQVSETLTGLPNLIPSDQNAARWNGDGDKDERSLNGSYSFPASSAAKAPESVGARGEGMVESWICSSE